MNLTQRPIFNQWPAGFDHQPTERRAEVRPDVAGLLSVLIPGAGQLYAGRTLRGVVMLGITIIGLFSLFFVWDASPLAVLAILVQPRYLVLLLIANVLVLSFRLLAVKDAFDSAGAHIRNDQLTLALLLALTIAPHVAVGYYEIVTIGLLNEIFSNGQGSANRDATTNEEYQLTIPVSPNRVVTPPN
jgi:hypothetical protein